MTMPSRAKSLVMEIAAALREVDELPAAERGESLREIRTELIRLERSPETVATASGGVELSGVDEAA